MKKAFLFLSTCLLAFSFSQEAAAQKKPRIGIAGIQIENSVFSLTVSPSWAVRCVCPTIYIQIQSWVNRLLGCLQ